MQSQAQYVEYNQDVENGGMYATPIRIFDEK